ncbi:MAG TPA: CAP domain-containing protein, partial [Anaerolineales bacterium]|nr:CAP domain-containing protein [Anaerolineales bacterium]
KQTALDIIAEVNALREIHNLPPFQTNPILTGIAQSHADYIASTGVLTHFSASGARPFQRAISAGYSVAGDLSDGGLFSENLLSGSNISASEVVGIWRDDFDQLTAMISPDLKDVGVGIASANGLTYYVLDAGASTDESLIDPTAETAGMVTSTPGTQIAAIITSTPLENGEVYHEVRPKEALWNIAIAYDTSVEQIKLLNALATDEIFPGQRLLIKKPPGSTVTAALVITATFGIPTSTATHPITPTITFTSTPLPRSPVTLSGGGLELAVIVLCALIAAALGSWLGRKK